VVAELAAEFRSEQDYLGECNKNRLLAAAECFAHAAIRRRSGSRDSCLDVEIRGLYPIYAVKSICGEANSINLYKFIFASIQEIGPEARYGGCQQLSLVRSRG
jgi:hypothetical protein